MLLDAINDLSTFIEGFIKGFAWFWGVVIGIGYFLFVEHWKITVPLILLLIVNLARKRGRNEQQ
jgi:hypothetical protein